MTFIIHLNNPIYTTKIKQLICGKFPTAILQSMEKSLVDKQLSISTENCIIFVDENNLNLLTNDLQINGHKRKNIFLVMITENNEYSIECIRHGFYDYLLLNNLENDFKFFSERISKQIMGYDKINGKNHILIKDHKSITKLEYNNIVFIEAYGSYSNLYTNNKFYTISKTIKSIIHNFPETFVRVHRSYAVNLDHVKSFSTDEVIMNNDTRIKISRAKKMALLVAIQKTA